MGLLVPKRTMEAPNVEFGICVWKLPNGKYIQNDNEEYLCAQGRIGDEVIEHRMKRSAKALGIEEGQPFWLPGFRKISMSEWESQLEELEAGRIPDPVDAWIQSNGG